MNAIDACELFDRCLAGRGSSGDWQEFVDRYEWQLRSVLRLTATRCGMPLVGPDLDEMVQELYCRLLSVRCERFRGSSEQELWSYLNQAIYSLVVDRKRALATQKRQPDRELLGDSSGLPARRLDPEQQLLGKERRKVFFERCLEIARCDRVVVEVRALKMALLEGWTSREIARQLEGGLNARQIDSLVHRLRRHLEKDGIRLPRRLRLAAAAPA
jgi:RNA polymerase sigma factor (sigma-70 family)